MNRLLLLYPKPPRALRGLLRDSGWDIRHRGRWVVDTQADTVFTLDLEQATVTVWPEHTTEEEGASARRSVTAPLYGLFAAIGEELYVRCDPQRDGVLAGARDAPVRSIRVSLGADSHCAHTGPIVRWQAARAASHLPPPWRVGPALAGE